MNNGVIINQYQQSDADAIVKIINRDQYNLQKGVTAEEFDRGLDEPGERIRENTFVALIHERIVGYIKGHHLCVERDNKLAEVNTKRGCLVKRKKEIR